MTVIMPDSNVFSNNQFLFLILLIVILQLRERKMKSWKVIILPVVMLLISLSIFYGEISNTYGIILMTIGFLIGIFFGIIIGRFMKVKLHPEDGSLILKGSYIAVSLWILIILLKIYGENFLNNSNIIRVDLIALIFLMMTLGTIISRRLFIYWKYLKHQKTENASNQ